MKIKFEEYKLSVDTISKNEIARSTIQILELQDSQYLPLGTGVIIELDKTPFMLTAAHVSTDYTEDHPLFVRIGPDDYISLSGEYRESDLSVNDQIDFAFVKLEGYVANRIARSKRFLDATNIGAGLKSLVGTYFVASGFPGQKTTVKDGNLEAIGVFHLTQEVDSKIYNKYGFSQDTHLIVEYADKGTDLISGDVVSIGRPHGISGGGLWYIWPQNYMGTVLMRYHLVGILSEVRYEHGAVLIACRVEPLIAKIVQDFNLNVIIEKSY